MSAFGKLTLSLAAAFIAIQTPAVSYAQTTKPAVTAPVPTLQSQRVKLREAREAHKAKFAELMAAGKDFQAKRAAAIAAREKGNKDEIAATGKDFLIAKKKRDALRADVLALRETMAALKAEIDTLAKNTKS